MENLDKIIEELKGMDKSKRKAIVNAVTKDPKMMEQLSGLLQNEDIQKKLKDLLR